MLDDSHLAIRAHGVRKRYPSAGREHRPALDGFDLEVARGSVHGLLGPNGAGKTTAVRIMTTLLDPDAGTVRVAGHDVAREGRKVRQRLGLVGQYAAVDEELSGRQNLVMFGRLSRLAPRTARHRAEELLEQFGLADTGSKQIGAYSGGMRRRLDLAAALIVAPEVLFVDEPTTGLDPAGRRDVWNAIRTLARGGTTVLLTTQYLEEADQLADRISLLAQGRVVAGGTPAELKARVGNDWLELLPRDSADVQQVIEIVTPWASGEIHALDGWVRVPVLERTSSLLGAAAVLQERRIVLADLRLHTPTLDDAFLQFTGTGAADDPAVPATADDTHGVPT